MWIASLGDPMFTLSKVHHHAVAIVQKEVSVKNAEAEISMLLSEALPASPLASQDFAVISPRCSVKVNSGDKYLETLGDDLLKSLDAEDDEVDGRHVTFGWGSTL